MSSRDQNLLKNCEQLKRFLFKAIPYVAKHPEEGESVAHFLMGMGQLTQGDMLNIFNGQTLHDISPTLRALLRTNRYGLCADEAPEKTLAKLKKLESWIVPHQVQNDHKSAEVFRCSEKSHVNGLDSHFMMPNGGDSPVKKDDVSAFKREFPLEAAWTDEEEQCVEIGVFADLTADEWLGEIKEFMKTFQLDWGTGESKAKGWEGGKSLAEFLKIIVLTDEHRGVLKTGAISEMFEEAIAAAKIPFKKPIMDEVRKWENFRERYDMVKKPTVDALDSPAKLQHGGAKRLLP